MIKSPVRSNSQSGVQKFSKDRFNVMINEDSDSNHAFKNVDQILGKERYPNVEIQISENSQISIRDILESLKSQGCSFENKTISYFDPKKKWFIFCRKEENLLDYKINLEDLSQKDVFSSCFLFIHPFSIDLIEMSTIAETSPRGNHDAKRSVRRFG